VKFAGFFHETLVDEMGELVDARPREAGGGMKGAG